MRATRDQVRAAAKKYGWTLVELPHEIDLFYHEAVCGYWPHTDPVVSEWRSHKPQAPIIYMWRGDEGQVPLHGGGWAVSTPYANRLRYVFEVRQ